MDRRQFSTPEVWCCAYTHPGEERTAAKALQDTGFRTYLPMLATQPLTKSCGHSKVGPLTQLKWEPMFPRYLFVLLDLSDDSWKKVMWAKGVVMVLGAKPGEKAHGEQDPLPWRVDGQKMVELMDACGGEKAEVVRLRPEYQPIETGEEVTIVEGPFSSLQAVVERSARDRVFVLMTMLGASTQLELKRSQIKRLYA
jgi:transcriptional antiterminator RfaH